VINVAILCEDQVFREGSIEGTSFPGPGLGCPKTDRHTHII